MRWRHSVSPPRLGYTPGMRTRLAALLSLLFVASFVAAPPAAFAQAPAASHAFAPADKLPFDPAVTVGTLPNGLR